MESTISMKLNDKAKPQPTQPLTIQSPKTETSDVIVIESDDKSRVAAHDMKLPHDMKILTTMSNASCGSYYNLIERRMSKINTPLIAHSIIDNYHKHKFKNKGYKNRFVLSVDDKAKKQKDTHMGYHLSPLLIDAKKNSAGELFICIGTRKLVSDLSKYKHIKCWISLKNKLKTKGKKKSYHFSVLIDLRKTTNLDREIERSILKNGFEKVLSFNLNPNHNIMNHIQIEGNNNKSIEKMKLNIEDAFMEYKDEFGILINEKYYTKSDEINEIESDEIKEIESQEIKDALQRFDNAGQRFDTACNNAHQHLNEASEYLAKIKRLNYIK